MEQSTLTALFLPLALFIIMLGMGMTLTIRDFRNIFIYPKAFFIGISNQLLLLPVIGFSIAWFFDMQPELAVGLILISLCPGGPTSNIISHLARADLALSVSLTAVSSLITNLTIPLFLNLALYIFMSETQTIRLPLALTIGQIFIITIVPVTIGMWIKKRFPLFTKKSLKSINLISAIFFIVLLAMVVAREWENIPLFFGEAGSAALLLNCIALTAGYYTGKYFNVNMEQRLSISIETGIQNGSLALALALSPLILNNSVMAIAPAIYSLLMFATAAVLVIVARNLNGH